MSEDKPVEGVAVIKEVAEPKVVEKIVEVEKIVKKIIEKVVEVEVEKIVEVPTGLDLSRAEMKGLLSHLPSTPGRDNVASAKNKLLEALDK